MPNGNGDTAPVKRGPGRPPGPCKTKYKKWVKMTPWVVGVDERTVAARSCVTRVDEATLRHQVDGLDARVARLMAAANATGDPAARLVLRERYGLVLPLVEARARGLPLCAVLSGGVDLMRLPVVGSGWVGG